MATTKLTNLLNPQVVGEYIDAKLVDKIKLLSVSNFNNFSFVA